MKRMMKNILAFYHKQKQENSIIYPESMLKNLNRINITSKIAIPLHLVIIVIYIFNLNRNPVLYGFFRWAIVLVHSFLLLVMIFLFFSSKKIKRTPLLYKYIPIMLYSLTFLILCTGFVISLFDQYFNGTIEYTPLTLVCLIVGSVFLLRPKYSSIIFSSVLFALTIALHFLNISRSDFIYCFVSGLVIIALGYLLSNISWQGFRKEMRQKQRIEYQQKQLRFMAYHDQLTELPNRYYLDQKIDIELKRMRERPDYRVCIMIIDIDGFKKINDNYGHPAGDEILKQLTRVLVKNTRESDTVARLGGEEFIVLLPNTDLKEGKMIGERLRISVMEEKFSIKKLLIRLTISIGLSLLLVDQINYYGLADSALYQAKLKGKNHVVIASEVNEYIA